MGSVDSVYVQKLAGLESRVSVYMWSLLRHTGHQLGVVAKDSETGEN